MDQRITFRYIIKTGMSPKYYCKLCKCEHCDILPYLAYPPRVWWSTRRQYTFSSYLWSTVSFKDVHECDVIQRIFIAGMIVGVVAGCTCAVCVILVLCLLVYRMNVSHHRKLRGYEEVVQKHIVLETPVVETKAMYCHAT